MIYLMHEKKGGAKMQVKATNRSISLVHKTSWTKKAKTDLRRNKSLYFLMIPGLLFLIVFKYIPMYGFAMAFEDFNIFSGITGSKWVGLSHFERLFTSGEFMPVFVNTLLISLYKIVFLFPAPIIIAIILNETRKMFFKRTIQTIVSLPHFLSWVIIGGLFIDILSPSGGVINSIITAMGGKSIPFLMNKSTFRGVLVISAGWKETGWNAIVYIAAIAGIDQEQYEAAAIDGAGRLRQIWYVTLPGIASTIIILLILRIGSVLDAGTEQILMLYNPIVYDVGDVISTYVYRMGLGKMEYSFNTAVGLFNSVIGFALVVGGNFISKKLVNKSIW